MWFCRENKQRPTYQRCDRAIIIQGGCRGSTERSNLQTLKHAFVPQWALPWTIQGDKYTCLCYETTHLQFMLSTIRPSLPTWRGLSPRSPMAPHSTHWTGDNTVAVGRTIMLVTMSDLPRQYFRAWEALVVY